MKMAIWVVGIVAVCAVFVCLSLLVVRAHEKKLAQKAEQPAEENDLPVEQEDEFFESPIYKAMEVIAHM